MFEECKILKVQPYLNFEIDFEILLLQHFFDNIFLHNYFVISPVLLLFCNKWNI